MRISFRLLALLPLPLLHGLGVLLGWAFYLTPNRHRTVTRRNLELCFPELSADERSRLERKSLCETGKTVFETPLIWSAGGKRVLGLIREVVGEENLKAALERGNGAIAASPHLGNWEMVGLYIGAHYPLTALYRPPRQQVFDALMHDARERLGATLVPTDPRGVRALMKALNRDEVAGILPDQEPREGGVFAPLFGHPAYTMTLLSRMSGKSGAPVVFSFAERLSWGRGFRMHFIATPEAIGSVDAEIGAAALNAAVEDAVRRAPAQYQWSYKRFRSRPEGEAGLY